MHNRVVGRIITINNNNIIAEVSNDLGSYINVYDGIRFVGEIGSYVSIDDIDRRIICEVIAIDEKNDMSFQHLNKAGSHRYLRLGLIGEIANSGFNFGVTKMPPIFSEIKIINENDLKLMLDVQIDEEKVDDENTRLKALTIGTSVIFPDYEVKVKLNDFFGFHFAVFGNTGAGKSNTIAKIIQNVFKKQGYSAYGAKFVIFDSNGEYEEAFKTINQINSNIKAKFLSTSDLYENKIEIPVWALSVDDWAVLLHATEKTQVPVLRRALELIQLFDTDDTGVNSIKIKNHILATVVKDILSSNEGAAAKSDRISGVLKKFGTATFNLLTTITIDRSLDIIEDKSIIDKSTIAIASSQKFAKMCAPANLMAYCDKYICNDIKEMTKTKKVIPFSLHRFLEAVEFAVIYEGSVNSAKIYEYTATLVTRLQSLIESDQGSFFVQTVYKSVKEYIESLLGDNQLVNIDISSLDDTATEVITKVISKLLFDYLKGLKDRNSMPVNLILEEAHRFIHTSMDYGVLGYNIFERIAKEGRKFGLLLGISSQRPSELSKTVVSQCSNFIIHRIQNPDDISYVSRMVPYISQGVIERITYLRRGYALVFGTAINIPTLTMFEKAEPSPNSGNSKITEKWYVSCKK
jgi:nucleoside-triphosphatase THEP1